MSLRGTADLLGMDHKTLQAMRTNLVEVVAKNSSYKGRKIVIYDSSSIETLIRIYASAFTDGFLRKNQVHTRRMYKRSVIHHTLLNQTQTVDDALLIYPTFQLIKL